MSFNSCIMLLLFGTTPSLGTLPLKAQRRKMYIGPGSISIVALGEKLGVVLMAQRKLAWSTHMGFGDEDTHV